MHVATVTYYGLRRYAGQDGDARYLGSEATPEEYLERLLACFREVRRVLRDDGVCFVNIGDSRGGSGTGGNDNKGNRGSFTGHHSIGDLNRMGIPERFALAMQADGWTWRDTVIWAKQTVMPESVSGPRWERCRVKQKSGWDTERPHPSNFGGGLREGMHSSASRGGAFCDNKAEWVLCPGCPKCSPNDGWVLRRGSWRTTNSHEYIYMFVKGPGYYCDEQAVAEPALTGPRVAKASGALTKLARSDNRTAAGFTQHDTVVGSTRNRRSVWTDITPEPSTEAHYATFPTDLPRICIQASTSEAGCCAACGAQWARCVEPPSGGTTGRSWHDHGDDALKGNRKEHTYEYLPAQTVDWRPTCSHGGAPVPSTVLDCFGGTMTTCVAAQRLGRRSVGVELSAEYLAAAVKRLEKEPMPLALVGGRLI